MPYPDAPLQVIDVDGKNYSFEVAREAIRLATSDEAIKYFALVRRVESLEHQVFGGDDNDER